MDKLDKLEKYNVSTPDWRTSIRKNQRNTLYVIIFFILIYFIVGFVIDLYLYANPKIPLSDMSFELATFKITPYATLIMLIVAGVSLLIAYLFHKNLVMLGTDYHEVTESSTILEERQLFNVVEEMRIASGLTFMPKIYIIEADYMNAFASGYTEKSALIAITRGLLQKLDRNELQAVMAHELTHVRNNDIRLTLTVAILSNLILIAIDLVFRTILFSGARSRDNRLVAVIIIARFLLPLITILLLLYLSRTREYMADAGSVELMRDNESLARALIKIHQDHTKKYDLYNQEYNLTPHEEIRNASYLYSPSYAGITTLGSINTLFSTHPSLEDRLKALGVQKRT